MSRESWGSKTGFLLAAIGSAIGLANIVKFPYMVGQNGGAAFIFAYLMCLLLIGLPVLTAEILIGRRGQSNPLGAMRKMGGNRFWTAAGGMIVLTGFIISGYYSALAAWILGYLFQALMGNVTHFTSGEDALSHFNALIATPSWGLSFHFLFLLICSGILYTGVRSGIERGSKIMMPLLFGTLLILVFKGLGMSKAGEGLTFLFEPDWSLITPSVIMMALGQSFFTLSVGQGTMITYGGYLSKKESLLSTTIPIVLADTVVSIMAAIAIFTIVFSFDIEPTAGLGLIFQTLPVIFSQMTGGYFFALLFFVLVSLAAITSEISAMEPAIAYLVDEWKWSRRKAVAVVGSAAFLVGVPVSLSANLLGDVSLFGMSIFDFVDFIATSVMNSIGALLAVILVAWYWGFNNAFAELREGSEKFFKRNHWAKWYYMICFKFVSPALIVLVFLRAIGVF
jgi:NSS family neurotransmitter:Na+ symporter